MSINTSVSPICELSILLPTFHDDCFELVSKLERQAAAINGLTFEIIVGDDGSTRSDVLASNRRINQLEHCKFIERGKNAGRAAIRNFLAQTARFENLLFIDSDMRLYSDRFIHHYLKCMPSPVVYGAYTVPHPSPALMRNLRYIYEWRSENSRRSEMRQQHPHRDFHTSNFLIRRDIMLTYPFDERFRHYGYEDVFFGRVLQEAGIGITHIDNPLLFDNFESNADFLSKTEEALRTLSVFRTELKGYSPLLSAAERINKWHLSGMVGSLHALIGGMIRKRLIKGKPSLLLFKIYKLGYLCRLMREDGLKERKVTN